MKFLMGFEIRRGSFANIRRQGRHYRDQVLSRLVDLACDASSEFCLANSQARFGSEVRIEIFIGKNEGKPPLWLPEAFQFMLSSFAGLRPATFTRRNRFSERAPSGNEGKGIKWQ
jgi:hypothetical protein